MDFMKQLALKHFRKPCSGYKLKEMTGSSIFAADAENGGLESDANLTPINKTGIRMYQVYNESSLFGNLLSVLYLQVCFADSSYEHYAVHHISFVILLTNRISISKRLLESVPSHLVK